MSDVQTTRVKFNCDKHGEYEQRTMPLFNKTLTIDTCPECAREEKEREQQAERERIKRDEEERYNKRKQNAGISPRNFDVKFKSFQCDTPTKQEVYNSVHGFAKAVYNGEQNSSLIVVGKVGTGKTMLANCVANSLVKSHNIKIIKLIDMIREIKATWRSESRRTETEIIEYYSRLDLLIIDEAGIGFGSDTEKMFIFDIIDGRYQNLKPTMIISNLNIEGLKEAMGERVVDRLRDGGGKMVVLDWESYRK